jgi:hypothetical protein
MLALRRPAGAAETLINYLPFAEEEVMGEVQSALEKLAIKDGKPEPALVLALTAARPTVRAAAAEALAKGGGAEALPAVRKLLDDADRAVRLRTGMALAPRDASAVPVLIGLMADLPAEQAWQVHDFLLPLAGDKAPPGPDDTAEARKKASAAWAEWWKDNSARAELAKLAAPHQHQVFGFVAICELNTGRITELGRDRKPRWSFTGTSNPVDVVVLPNNRVVVAEQGGNRVTERDLKGNIIWQKQLTTYPWSIQRLPNGHTLMTTNAQIVEVDRNGKDVLIINSQNRQFSSAYKDRKGQIICLHQNGVCAHLDTKGNQLKSFNTNRNNAYMDLLPNGRILLAQNGGNSICEYDQNGKLHLELNAPNVSAVTGLPNGNILVASYNTNRVMEMDRKGKIVWEYTTGQNPWRARGR